MITRLVLVLAVILQLCSSSAQGQEPANPAPPFRLLQFDSGDVTKVQQTVDKASADGYVVESAWPSSGHRLLMLRQRRDSEPQPAYRVLKGKETIEQGLAEGYRAVPEVLDLVGRAPVVLAYKSGETERYESLLLNSRTTDALDRDIQQAASKGFRVISMETVLGRVHSAVLERPAGASSGNPSVAPTAFIAAARQATIQRELDERAAAGYCIACTTAGNEVVISMERCKGDSRMEYRVVLAGADEDLEREINAAAKEGFRYRPGTLEVVTQGAYLIRYVAIMEKGTGSEPAGEYLMLSTARVGTLIREFDEAVAKGYSPVALNPDMTYRILLERGRR